ncbi:MAG: thioesterase family protein [Bacteroidetes bacterium]|nr:thioesterase family protein [Bacteroidota bacterium]HET6243592.1 thioesterase family protein [Bacteroidia bacterium]
MARIKIEMPQYFLFSTEIKIRINDINYGGHLGNDALLSIIHEARIQFLNNFGYSEIEIEGASLIMADSAIIYKSEGFYGEVLLIQIHAADFGTCGFDFYYNIINKVSGKQVATAKTGMVFFEYTTRKIKEVPEKFKNLFS